RGAACRRGARPGRGAPVRVRTGPRPSVRAARSSRPRARPPPLRTVPTSGLRGVPPTVCQPPRGIEERGGLVDEHLRPAVVHAWSAVLGQAFDVGARVPAGPAAARAFAADEPTAHVGVERLRLDAEVVGGLGGAEPGTVRTSIILI